MKGDIKNGGCVGCEKGERRGEMGGLCVCVSVFCVDFSAVVRHWRYTSATGSH